MENRANVLDAGALAALQGALDPRHRRGRVGERVETDFSHKKTHLDGGSAPFLLFEDARPDKGDGRLFERPREIIVAYTLHDVATALERVRAALGEGRYVAGWLSYEAGFALEARLMVRAKSRSDRALLWFGVFERQALLTRAQIEQFLPSPGGAWLSPPRPRISQEAYASAFERIQHYIARGDVYQVNLSYRADVTLRGGALAAYAQLRKAGQGGWSAVVRTQDACLISTSPELFFSLKEGRIEARPMKGTARRYAESEMDRRAAEALQTDEKERAENLMIVDLLRNDISRIAQKGSVRVPALFSVETYPTLHTLTSTVRAQLKEECDAIDALWALFPCGSITGAPKIRAMEIIDELESDARGPYAGSIGWIAPNGDAEFNVAIRTLFVKGERAELGLGSAIVLDSNAQSEWEECRTKGAFIRAGAPEFKLIETMRFDAGIGLARLDRHLSRLRASAEAFRFAFDNAAIRNALETALAQARSSCVVRLLLAEWGEVSIELRELPQSADVVTAALAPLPVDPHDFRLRHKTTLRDFYDDVRARSDAQEVIFADSEGFVTEGSFTNVFVKRGSSFITPPANRGLLPGVLRADLLAGGDAREGDLRAEDLAAGFFLGNAVRGLMPARLLASHAAPATIAQIV